MQGAGLRLLEAYAEYDGGSQGVPATKQMGFLGMR